MYYQKGFLADRWVRTHDMLWTAAMVAATIAAVGYTVTHPSYPPAPVLQSSTVMVEDNEGHGSGVHIGDGLVLTAAHVANGAHGLQIVTADGKRRDAETLWVSPEFDVALLRTSSAGLSTSELSCLPPVIGSAVRAEGSPLDLGQITTYGHLVGGSRSAGEWRAVATVDMTILPGMSGGPILNAEDAVVGLSVGVATDDTGFGPFYTGIGMIVPSEVICDLIDQH